MDNTKDKGFLDLDKEIEAAINNSDLGKKEKLTAKDYLELNAELTKKIQICGDKDGALRDKLFKLNESIIYVVLKRFGYKNMTQEMREMREDFRQAALLGLWEAVKDYQPSSETKFSSFAFEKVKDEVLQCTRAYNKFAVGESKDQLEAYSKVCNCVKSNTPEKLPTKDVQPKALEAMVSAARTQCISIDAIADKSNTEVSIDAMLENDGMKIECGNDDFEKVNIRLTIDSLLKQLKPELRDIIVARFGLNGDEPMSFEKCGETLGLTRLGATNRTGIAIREFKALAPDLFEKEAKNYAR